MNDETAISLAKEGHEDAFRYLYDANRERIYAMAYRYTRSRQEAEDIMQETFIRAFGKIGSFESGQGSSFAAWLTRICINYAIQRLRRQKRRKMDRMMPLADMTQEIASKDPSPEDCAVDSERHDLLERAVGKLSPAQRVMFDLRYSRHLPIKEIAGYMGCSESNVKTQIHRSIHKLKRELEPLWRDQ